MNSWTQILLVMALLNFTLNIASVYLGWWKRKNLGDGIEHILSHVCPHFDEYENESFEDIGIGIPDDVEFVEDWVEYCHEHIVEHGRLPTQNEIEKHFDYQQETPDNSQVIKEWDES
jgi:hypothetical protein|tara:strand:+ start:2744 stop:3094 length:351 start_codon:yes stop_codon:yes gene_type:complete